MLVRADPPKPPNVTLVERAPTYMLWKLTPPPPVAGSAFITFWQVQYRAAGESWRPPIWFPLGICLYPHPKLLPKAIAIAIN